MDMNMDMDMNASFLRSDNQRCSTQADRIWLCMGEDD